MKLINDELRTKIWNDAYDKVLEHAPYGNPVRKQIQIDFGLWGDDNLFILKIQNQKLNIMSDLNETN